MMPERIQRKRTAGWRMPPNTVSVTRPGRFSNPFRVGMYADYTAADAVRDFKKWFRREPVMRSCEHVYGQPPTRAEVRKVLRGKNLACWCEVGAPFCHADFYLEVANG